MNEAVRRVIESAAARCCDYSDNNWNGADFDLSDGGTLRIAQEGGEEEEIEMYRFDERMMLEWKVSFSASTPAVVVAAGVRKALEGGS